MTIDFQTDCSDIPSAEAIAAMVPGGEFAITINQDSADGTVTCQCSREMLLDHAELVRIQRMLTDIAKPLGGWCESWGTFGNA